MGLEILYSLGAEGAALERFNHIKAGLDAPKELRKATLPRCSKAIDA
jgi:hypothetical protein